MHKILTTTIDQYEGESDDLKTDIHSIRGVREITNLEEEELEGTVNKYEIRIQVDGDNLPGSRPKSVFIQINDLDRVVDYTVEGGVHDP